MCRNALIDIQDGVFFMIGPIMDSIGIVLGSILGSLWGKRIPESLRNRLPLVFGCVAMGIGVSMIVQVNNLTPVIISILLGTIIGELLKLESGINYFGHFARRIVNQFKTKTEGEINLEEYSEKFASMIILFGFSGVAVVGAITEGLTGDASLLVVKSLLDFLTAIIFATSLGFALAATSLLQFIVQASLFWGAVLIAPYMNDTVMGDFSAVGGFVMLATGFNICRVAQFPVTSMLPSLVLSLPLSSLWLSFV